MSRDEVAFREEFILPRERRRKRKVVVIVNYCCNLYLTAAFCSVIVLRGCFCDQQCVLIMNDQYLVPAGRRPLLYLCASILITRSLLSHPYLISRGFLVSRYPTLQLLLYTVHMFRSSYFQAQARYFRCPHTCLSLNLGSFALYRSSL